MGIGEHLFFVLRPIVDSRERRYFVVAGQGDEIRPALDGGYPCFHTVVRKGQGRG